MKVELLASRYEDEKIIKDLGLSFVFTNSERNELGCPKRWYFSYYENLRMNNISHSLQYGIYWHMVMESLFLFWKMTDEDLHDLSHNQKCNNMIRRTLEEIAEDASSKGLNSTELVSQLVESLTGYVSIFGEIRKEFKVLEVEVPLRFPILNYKGERFKSKVILEDIGDRYIVANPKTIGAKRIEVEMPFYVVGRADAIVQSRESGEIFIYDHKTTGSVNRFIKTVEVDPQLVSYAAMFDYEKTEGHLQKYKQHKIGGVIYGLASNQVTSAPKILKDKSLSKAKHQKIPSWTYKRFIQDNNLNILGYESHLDNIRLNVDPLWHKRLWYPLDKSSLERWKQESYGIARNLADKYRCLATIPNGKDWIAPRIPTCKTTGFCSYKEICVEDTPLQRSMNYEVEQKLYWKKNPKWR
jgi:hypothetical protein